jgi:hypothetical protein
VSPASVVGVSEKKDEGATYLGVGVAFGGLAVVMGLTMDNWAFALPFGALALTFFIMGSRRSRTSPDDSEG